MFSVSQALYCVCMLVRERLNMAEYKYSMKKIETQLTVKLMNGMTTRDVWTDFFGGKIPDEIIIIDTRRVLGDFNLSEDLYNFIVDNCKDKEFLKFLKVKEGNVVNPSALLSEIYKKIAFNYKMSGDNVLIYTEINLYSIPRSLDKELEFNISIKTYSYVEFVTEADVKAWNRLHTKALRKYLVGLPSVQGVPYTCSYKDEVQVERSCEV